MRPRLAAACVQPATQCAPSLQPHVSEVGEVEQPKLQLDDAHFERFRCWECRTLWEARAREAGQGQSRPN